MRSIGGGAGKEISRPLRVAGHRTDARPLTEQAPRRTPRSCAHGLQRLALGPSAGRFIVPLSLTNGHERRGRPRQGSATGKGFPHPLPHTPRLPLRSVPRRPGRTSGCPMAKYDPLNGHLRPPENRPLRDDLLGRRTRDLPACCRKAPSGRNGGRRRNQPGSSPRPVQGPSSRPATTPSRSRSGSVCVSSAAGRSRCGRHIGRHSGLASAN